MNIDLEKNTPEYFSNLSLLYGIKEIELDALDLWYSLSDLQFDGLITNDVNFVATGRAYIIPFVFPFSLSISRVHLAPHKGISFIKPVVFVLGQYNDSSVDKSKSGESGNSPKKREQRKTTSLVQLSHREISQYWHFFMTDAP